MASGNGSAPNHITNLNDLPIIGEPMTVGAMITTVMKCLCGSPVTLMSQVVNKQLQSAPNVCMDCRSGWAITAMTVDAAGTVGFRFQKIAVQPQLLS